jgi:mRNA interferase RelE/StbE
MSYTVKVSRPAEKFLRSLTDKKLYQRLREAIDSLEENPRPPNGIKLQGVDELYRIRTGDYRIAYQIQDQQLTVLVIQIGHRREIYR